MYNRKDIQFEGKHDFDEATARWKRNWISNKSPIVVPIFKWELRSSRKSLKKGKIVVKVLGLPEAEIDQVIKKAEEVVSMLDAGTWTGKKSIRVK